MARYVSLAERLAAATSTVTDIPAATPPQIDAVLAQTYALRTALLDRRGRIVDAVHRALGERGREHRGWTQWPTLHEEAITAARARAAAPGYNEIPGSRRDVARPLAELDWCDADLAEVDAAEAPFQARYTAERWTRYFWANSNGGHGHRSMSCPTCNKGRTRTVFDWHPELSGLTDDDAIKAFNAQMCSVCFPGAPVAVKASNHCEGSRKAPVKGSDRRVGMRFYGTCTGCEERQLLAGAYVRAHKPPKSKPAATPATG